MTAFKTSAAWDTALVFYRLARLLSWTATVIPKSDQVANKLL